MEYRIDTLDSLETEQSRFVDKVLEAFDTEGIGHKVNSNQLYLPARETDGLFTLRCNDDPVVDFESLSVNTEMLPNHISFRFVVPSFQRGYRWDEEMVKDLIDDIYANFRKYHKNQQPRGRAARYVVLTRYLYSGLIPL
jgi:hypothetical protein